MDPEQANARPRSAGDGDAQRNDSLDKSAAEEAIARAARLRQGQHRARARSGCSRCGSRCATSRSSRRRCTRWSTTYDKQTRFEISTADYDIGQGQSMEYDVPAAMRKRRVKHADATRATIKLGLQRFEHTYGRAKCSASIPPGYYDVAQRWAWTRRSRRRARSPGGAPRAAAASAASSTRTTPTRSSARPTSARRTGSRSWRPTSRPLGTTAPS